MKHFLLLAALFVTTLGCEKKVEIKAPGVDVKVGEGGANVEAGKLKIDVNK